MGTGEKNRSIGQNDRQIVDRWFSEEKWVFFYSCSIYRSVRENFSGNLSGECIITGLVSDIELLKFRLSNFVLK